MTKLKTILAWIVALSMSAGAGAESHALLIGIGHYPELTPLEGPINDIPALRAELVDRWGFAPSRVITLTEQQATKRAILAALDRLVEITRPGDFVLVYYSGHGTSAFDEDLRQNTVQLPRWTGALMPWDYATRLPPRPTAMNWIEGLIIGRTDLRPRLAELDRGRDVFVVFDTCFSGNAVRSISSRRVRWVPPPGFLTRGIEPIDPAPGPSDPIVDVVLDRQGPRYPYRGLVYLAAARQYERAEEAPPTRTSDGLTHGALTYALLTGLAGAADGDGDGELSYRELYDYVRDDVTRHHQHMPQLLYPENGERLVERPVFGRRGIEVRPPAVPTGPGRDPAQSSGNLRVALGPGLGVLRHAVESLAGVTVDARDPHLELRRERDGLVALYHSSDDRIAGGYRVDPPSLLLERVARQARVQELIDLAYDRQDFSLRLELMAGGNALAQGFLRQDQRFTISAHSSAPAFLLLLNIDKAGSVSVLYPMSAAELAPGRGIDEIFEVVEPYGTEYLKLLAFRRPPEGLAAWIGRKIDALDSDFGDFLELLQSSDSGHAQTRLKVVTVGQLTSARPSTTR